MLDEQQEYSGEIYPPGEPRRSQRLSIVEGLLASATRP